MDVGPSPSFLVASGWCCNLTLPLTVTSTPTTPFLQVQVQVLGSMNLIADGKLFTWTQQTFEHICHNLPQSSIHICHNPAHTSATICHNPAHTNVWACIRQAFRGAGTRLLTLILTHAHTHNQHAVLQPVADGTQLYATTEGAVFGSESVRVHGIMCRALSATRPPAALAKQSRCG